MPRPPQVSPSVSSMQGSVYSMLAHRLEQRTGEVYPFHVGDTWMEPAEGCRMEDLTVAEHPGLHRYAPVQGLPALVDAVVERQRQRTGLAVERRDVLVAAGATGALGAVVGAIVAPGDEVLILAPYWPLIAGIVRSFHGAAVPVPFFEHPDPGSALAALSAALTERTVALYLSTPNNPTGRVIPAALLERVCGWAADRGLWLLADEVYEDYQFAGAHTYARPLAPDRTFSAHSFSKAYGMAGNRCGYVIGPAATLAEVVKVSVNTYYAAPTASQVAALRALGGPGDAWAADTARSYEAVGTEAARRLGVAPPGGSTFLFVDAAKALDDRGLGGFLEDLADQGVLVAPGTSFGPYPTHFRLCYTAAPPEQTLRGVDVLARRLRR